MSKELSRFTLIPLALAALWLAQASPGHAFCGFYVAKADASLYNEASQVVVARHDGKTVISMLNDFQGDLEEFALVVPVPVVLEEGQIHVAEKELFEHLDAYSAPRLVEYFDDDPCQQVAREESSLRMSAMAPTAMADASVGRGLGVTVEAAYTVGEYDIVILSAKESDGLETWLRTNGYHIPAGASRALQPYIRQNMKFFVAKVNLKEQKLTGVQHLRPLQFAFESDRFMLPIRLGMSNSKGPQELIVYLLTKEGRVETTNYRTVRLPSDREVPVYVKEEFGPFYKAMFDKSARDESMRAVFTEYVWNMGWCDPCAANPLSTEELRNLGVFWLKDDGGSPGPRGRRVLPGGGPLPVMLTRLHLRYTPETFPEDLVFQETADQENFQGRYVIRHPWSGDPGACREARRYFTDLRERQETEAQTLAELTGWKLDDIRSRMKLDSEPVKPASWWDRLWK
jgi:hypothetical protein